MPRVVAPGPGTRAQGAPNAPRGGAYRIGARLRQPVARTGATPAGDKTRRGQRACACAIKKPNAPLSSAKSYCLNPAHRRQGMRKLCLEHFAPLKHGACTMGNPRNRHRRAHSPMRPVLQYMGGGRRGESARAAGRVAHLGGCARARSRRWWWGRHLLQPRRRCAPSNRGHRPGGVWRAGWRWVADVVVDCN